MRVVLNVVVHIDWDCGCNPVIPARLHLKQHSTLYNHHRHNLNALVHIWNVSSVTTVVGNEGRDDNTEVFISGCALQFQRKFL